MLSKSVKPVNQVERRNGKRTDQEYLRHVKKHFEEFQRLILNSAHETGHQVSEEMWQDLVVINAMNNEIYRKIMKIYNDIKA